MIRHIFKIIWNERKANAWIVLEYIIVFCVLWFCVDYLFFIGRGYVEPMGYDTKDLYQIKMVQREVLAEDGNRQEPTKEELQTYVNTFLDRVKRQQDVENVALSHSGIPYGFSESASSFNINGDSLRVGLRTKWVTSDFFDVFKMKVEGRIFDWQDPAATNQVVISPDRHGRFGDYPEAKYPLKEVRTVCHNPDEDPLMDVIGTVGRVKDYFYEPYKSTLFLPLGEEHLNLADYQIVIRLKPGHDTKDFKERFVSEMRSQLNIGPFFLASITPFKEIEEEVIGMSLTELNGVYSITAFLFINIFLGLIGTFWYRTQTRRGEIGLRIALGASRRKTKELMFGETLLLLFISSVIAVNICVNIGQTELLERTLGIPVADRVQMGSGVEQEFITYGLTFLFLAVVSLVAVWYPSKQASDIPPAEALREE